VAIPASQEGDVPTLQEAERDVSIHYFILREPPRHDRQPVKAEEGC